MKLGVLIAGKRADDLGRQLDAIRNAGYFLCQLNLMQTGATRTDLLAIADALLEYGVRPVAIGCYVNPMRPDEPSFMGVGRDDLDVVLHSLDLLGARRVVFWSGTHADTLFDDHPDNLQVHSLDMLRDFLDDLVASTRARRYELVIEPYKTHILRTARAIVEFHNSLPPATAERVQYVLDAPNLITAQDYSHRDDVAEDICRTLGPYAGVAHLKDCIMPPDGEEALLGPGQGRLDYPRYVQAILQNVADEVPAIVKGAAPAELANVRDFLLRLTDRWELA
ncbi:MAG: sugar phosphate isomerase/epimerase family protein [Chthonomonadales bacterium]